MKIIRILFVLLILFVCCGTVWGADGNSTSDVSQDSTVYQNVNLDPTLFDNIIMMDGESNIYRNNGAQQIGPYPDVDADGEDKDDPINAMINESFEFEFVFRNSGDSVGFQPYFEVIVPDELADLEFTYLEHKITVIEVGRFTEENRYTLVDPYTNDKISGSEGQRLLLVIPPLGSYTTEVPDTSIYVDGFLNTTKIGNLLNFTITPIFRFGADPLDNPQTDPPIRGDTVTGWVNPSVVQVEIDTPVHEYETATGPNFPYKYNITVDIANGATVEDIVISNTLPPQVYFINSTNHLFRVFDKDGNEIDPSLYEVILPDSNYTGGDLTVRFKNYTGSAEDDDIVIEYWVYAPEFDNSTGVNLTIIDPVTGANNVTTNVADIECDYNGTDCRDDDDVHVTLKSLAIQKVVNEYSSVHPNEELTYTIYFEVSDYFSFQGFYMLDHAGELPMGAGQDFIWDSVTLTFKEQTYDLENHTYYRHLDIDKYDGHWDLYIYVFRYLNDHDIVETLEGGLFDDRYINRGPLVGEVSYKVKVNLNYMVGNETISADDLIINLVDGVGNLLESGNEVTDSSRTQLRVPSPEISKEIVAIDGVFTQGYTDLTVSPGQNVTFLLDVHLPTGTIDDFTLTDFFPIPLFNVTGFNIVNSTNYELPSAGHWAYAEGSDFVRDLEGNVVSPVVTVNTVENTVILNFGNTLFNESSDLDLKIWITLQVTHEPKADELYLANLLYLHYTDSINTTYMTAEIVHMITQEPELNIVKDVNTTYVENNTHVQYTIFVENIGHSSAFDVIVTDNFLELYNNLIKNGVLTDQIVGISASYGNGTAIDIDMDDFFNTSKGFEVGYLGSLANNESNNFTIVYDVIFNEHVYVEQEITNTANITNFASREDGDNFVTNPERYSDDATVIGETINPEKEFIGSNDYNSTWGSLVTEDNRKQNLTIGESGIFDIVINLPELIVENLTIVDYINGMNLLDFELNINGTIVNKSNAGEYGIDVTIKDTDDRSSITIVFNGDSTKYSTNSKIALRMYYVVVNDKINSPTNTQFTRKNTVEVYLDGDFISAAEDSVTIVQPKINIVKDFYDDSVQGGESTGFDLTVSNSGKSPAYNVTFSDDLTGLLQFVDSLDNVNITVQAAGNNVTYSWNNRTVDFALDKLDVGESVKISFKFNVLKDIIIGSEYKNIANVTGSSLPDDKYNETRNYTSKDDDTLRTDLPKIDKNVVDSSIDNGLKNAAVGEYVTWEIVVNLPEGNYTNLTISDTFVRGVEFINATVYIKGTASDVYRVVYNNVTKMAYVEFTNVSSAQLNGTVRILINTTVTNVTDNYNGASRNNKAILYLNNKKVGEDTDSIRIVEPNIPVEKSSNKVKYEYNETVEYTIVIKNNGNTPAFNVVLKDTIPEELIYSYENSTSKTIADGWTITYDESTRTFTITGNVLEVGDSLTFKYNCTFDQNYDLLGKDFINNVNVTYNSANRTDIYRDYYNEDDNTVHVIATDLAVDKEISSTLIAGQPVFYVITVTNKGPDDAQNVLLLENPQRDDLTDIQYRIGNGAWTDLPYDGLISLGTIKADQKVTIQVRAFVNSDVLGNITNFVDVSTTTNETDYTNNNDTVVEDVDTVVDLNVVKVTNSTVVIAGTDIYYNVTVENKGPSDARDVVLRDYFNKNDLNNMQYSLDGITWFAYENGYAINLGNITAGDSRKIYFRASVKGTTRGNILNTANISTSTPNTGNNSSSVENEVISDVLVTIEKIGNVTAVNPGDYITYIIYVNLTGNSTSENVWLRDVLNTTLLDVDDAIYSINQVNMGKWTGNVLLGSVVASPSYFVIEITNIHVKDTADRDIPNTATVTTDDYPDGLNSSWDIHVNIVDLAINKTVTFYGNYSEEVIYFITVTNNGPDNSTDVVVSDLLPEGLIYIGSASSRGYYDYVTGIWNVGLLMPNENHSLTIFAAINKTGEIVNNASVTGGGHDSNESNNNDSVDIDVPPAADLAVDKIVVSYGNYTEEIVYIISVTNKGPDVATGVVANDVLPDSLIYISSEVDVGSYNASSGIWDIGSLNPGDSVNMTIVAKINRTGLIVNSANVTANEYDPNLTDNNDSEDVEIPPSADLAIDKIVVSCGNYSDEIVYMIVVTNNGPDVATGVTVKDLLPESLIYVSYSTDRGSYNSSSGIWYVDNMEIGESVNITIVARINGTGLIVNHANVTGNEYETNMSNNNDTETVEIPPEVDLVVNKTAEGTIILWENMTYVIVVTNQGIDLATNVNLTDVLPDSLIYLGSASTKGKYDPVAGIWNIGELAVGENATLYINCTINRTGNITNEAFANSTEHDLNYTNNNDTAVIEVPFVADLEVIKVSNLDKVTVGDEVIFFITVVNHGPDTAVNVTAYDKLPDGLGYISHEASAGIYDPKTGIWSIGDLEIGENATLTIVVVALKDGIIVNNVLVNSSTMDLNESNNNDSAEIEADPIPIEESNPTDKTKITMEKTGNPFMLAAVLLIFLLGLGVNRRKK